MINILILFIVSAVIILAAVLLLGMKIFFSKKGEFPNIHIGRNKGLKDKGVSCATSQDAEAQRNHKRIDIEKIIKETQS